MTRARNAMEYIRWTGMLMAPGGMEQVGRKGYRVAERRKASSQRLTASLFIKKYKEFMQERLQGVKWWQGADWFHRAWWWQGVGWWYGACWF